MAAIESRNLIHRNGSLSSNSEDMQMEDDSAANLLQSVREQEEQFALLTKEIEEERKTVAQQLNNDQYSPRDHNGDMDNNTYRYDTPQGEKVTETFSRREDYSDPREETEVLVDDDGVSKTVTKRIVTKTVTERRVRQIEDTDSLPRSNHSDLSRQSPRHSSSTSNRNYDSVQRNHNNRYSPQDDENTGLLQRRSSGSSSSGSEEARKPSGYSYPPPPPRAGSSEEVVRNAQPEKFQPEDYGLEDDRHSDYSDDGDQYGLEPSAYREDPKRRSVSSNSDNESYRYDEQQDRQSPDIRDPRNDSTLPSAAPRTGSKHVGRAPLAMLDAASQGSLNRVGKNWHTPSLEEVIKMLSYNMPVVQQNASAFIQHLCYNDDKTKADVRILGGIPPLIKLLDHDSPDVELNACGALRNLCYGPSNDKNKIEIKKHEGVPAVVRLIRSTKDMDAKEQATGALWNLSAHPELKGQVLELGLEPLTNLIIIPYSESVSSQQDSKPKDIVMVDVFTNAVGVVRNLSSTDSQDSRKKLRECSGLLLALVTVLKANKESDDIDNKRTENCMCILRNLTFKLQDETTDWTELYMLEKPRSASNDKSSTSCFGKKSKDEPEVVEQIPPDEPDADGEELLWQPNISRLYVALLQDCHRQEIIEAALGALQNLSSGVWKWALYCRAVVRKEKGLPIIIDRLRTDNDQIVRVGTTALTNLAEDSKNKELIGKFAMKDLVYKLPGGTDPNIRHSDKTVIAILNTIRMLVEKNPENVKHLREAQGIERVTTINNSREQNRFKPRVVKAAGLVLKAVWANKSTRSLLKKDGWNQNHFTPTVTQDTLPRKSGVKKNNRTTEDPQSSSAAASTGGRRAQRNASQTDEVQMSALGSDTSDSTRRNNADSYV